MALCMMGNNVEEMCKVQLFTFNFSVNFTVKFTVNIIIDY